MVVMSKFSGRVGLVVGYALSAALCVAMAATVAAEQQTPQLMRVLDHSDGGELQVPVIQYAGKNGLRVDFVGAVHLGEPAYYEGLNRRFDRYEAVLFELVSEAGGPRPGKGERRDSTLGIVQRKMSEFLGLQFQLDGIDYSKRSFVHADMSPDELTSAMKARGESMPQMLLKLLKLSTRPDLKKQFEGLERNMLEDLNPISIVLRGSTTETEARALRRYLAHGLAASDDLLMAMEGTDGLSITTDRNAVVMKKLREQVALGRKNLAIFYGVGHLPDLHRRLMSEFGFRVESIEWVRAWGM
jgi:hypothetical protein